MGVFSTLVVVVLSIIGVIVGISILAAVGPPVVKLLGRILFFALTVVAQLGAGVVGLLAFPVVLLRCLWRQFATVWRMMAMSKVLRPDTAGGAEPAYPAYFHSSGWQDLRTVWTAVKRGQEQARDRARSIAAMAFTADDRDGLLALGFGSASIGIALTRPVVWLLRVVATAFHLLALGVGFALWHALRFLTAGADRIARRVRGVRLACPHLDCGRAIALPVYLCPACGAEHRALAPNQYGALRHTCRCGARLPAAALVGAHRLEARCPSCGGALPRRAARTRLRTVVLAGGSGSGRSTIRGRAAGQIRDHAKALGGTPRSDTPEPALLDLTGLRGQGVLLALLDPPGAAFGTQEATESLGCLSHADGLVLVVDPLALPEVRRSLDHEDRARIGRVPAATDDPARAVERVVHVVRALPAARRPRRIAVVLSKSGVVRRTSAGAGLDGGDDDAAVRDWVDRSGGGNLMRTIELTDAKVRYAATGEGGTDDSTALGELLLWAAGARVARRVLRAPGGRSAQDRLAARLKRAMAVAARRKRLRERVPGSGRDPLSRRLGASLQGRRQRAELLRRCGPYAERRPAGWVPGGRQDAPPPALLAARRGLLLSHLAGLAALPLALALLFTGALPAVPFGVTSVAAAYDKWRHPLDKSVHDVDLAARTQGAGTYPRASASFSSKNNAPSLAQAQALALALSSVSPSGTAGSTAAPTPKTTSGYMDDYWSTEDSRHKEDWLGIDFGLPTTFSRATVTLRASTSTQLKIGMPSSYRFEYWTGKQWRLALRQDVWRSSPTLVAETLTFAAPITASRIRVVVPRAAHDYGVGIDEINIWRPSSTSLQMLPSLAEPVAAKSTGVLRLELRNTLHRDLKVAIAPPVLPSGWKAEPVTTPGTTVPADGTLSAKWRLTTRKGPGSADFTVRITEGGKTVTARCRASLTRKASGYELVPAACETPSRVLPTS